MEETTAAKALVQRYFDAFERGDVEGMAQLQSANFWYCKRGDQRFLGAEAIQNLEHLIETSTSRQVTVFSMIAENGTVAVEYSVSIEFPSEIYRCSYHDVFFTEGDEIYARRAYADPPTQELLSGQVRDCAETV